LRYALDVLIGNQDNKFDWRRMPSASMFWSDCTNYKIISNADGYTVLVALLFGAIHCVAWPFSSSLWRFSCAIMIAVPGLLASFGVVYLQAWEDGMNLPAWGSPEALRGIWGLFFGAFLYICARVITFTLAFMTLRSLPATAYETVQWTRFVPHV
jgi:hypothetical protein